MRHYCVMSFAQCDNNLLGNLILHTLRKRKILKWKKVHGESKCIFHFKIGILAENAMYKNDAISTWLDLEEWNWSFKVYITTWTMMLDQYICKGQNSINDLQTYLLGHVMRPIFDIGFLKLRCSFAWHSKTITLWSLHGR